MDTAKVLFLPCHEPTTTTRLATTTTGRVLVCASWKSVASTSRRIKTTCTCISRPSLKLPASFVVCGFVCMDMIDFVRPLRERLLVNALLRAPYSLMSRQARPIDAGPQARDIPTFDGHEFSGFGFPPFPGVCMGVVRWGALARGFVSYWRECSNFFCCHHEQWVRAMLFAMMASCRVLACRGPFGGRGDQLSVG